MRLFELTQTYLGNCTMDHVVDDIFGSVSEFARQVEEHGDEFEVGDYKITYNDDTDVHSFYLIESADSTALDTFTQSLKNKYNVDKLWTSMSSADTIRLDSIIVSRSEQKSGVGTAIMNELCKYADAQGLRIILSPGRKDDNHGTTSRSRLVKFYKRFGFKENKGRNKDFAISAGMIRNPQ